MMRMLKIFDELNFLREKSAVLSHPLVEMVKTAAIINKRMRFFEMVLNCILFTSRYAAVDVFRVKHTEHLMIQL